MARRISPPLTTRWFSLLVAVTLICTLGGQAVAQSTETRAPSSPVDSPDTSIIPSSRIADEAMQLDQRLRTLPDRFVPESLLTEIHEEVNQLRAATSERSSEMEASVSSDLLLAELQQSLLEWQPLSNQVTELAEDLTGWATSLETEACSMRESESIWTRTYDRLRAERSPAKLRQLARKAIADIGAAADLIEEQRARIAALQEYRPAGVAGRVRSSRPSGGSSWLFETEREGQQGQRGRISNGGKHRTETGKT